MLITNAKLITWERPNRILENHAMLVLGDRIQELGAEVDLLSRYPNEEQLDAGGQYVMPGNICAHTHFYGAFARGMTIPGQAPKDFPDILRKLWWPLDRALGAQDVLASAEVMLVNAIRHGVTTLFDHHASPHAIEGSLDIIAGAVDQSGLRAVLCYEVTDRNGDEGALAGIQENVRFINRTRHEVVAEGRVAATFGLHASLTLSDATLEACRLSVPESVGFHLHLAEGEADEYDSLARSGTRTADRLHRHGILGVNSIVAHGVHLDAREALLVAETGTWLTHQPRSNMNNGVGVANVEALLRLGIPVCIGTDGFFHAMWDEWKAAYLLQKVWNRDPRRMNGADIVEMGVYNNAALAGKFFTDAPIEPWWKVPPCGQDDQPKQCVDQCEHPGRRFVVQQVLKPMLNEAP